MDQKEYDRLKALNIRIYTTPTCAPCHEAKKYLDDHGVPYKAYDITKDPMRMDEMLKITGGARGVPVICYGGKFFQGYGHGLFKQLIGI